MSLQKNDSFAPAWIMTGRWALNSMPSTGNNSDEPNLKFNANLTMANVDGSSSHRHRLANFKLSDMTFQNRTAILGGRLISFTPQVRKLRDLIRQESIKYLWS